MLTQTEIDLSEYFANLEKKRQEEIAGWIRPIDHPLVSPRDSVMIRTDSQMIRRDMGGCIMQVGTITPFGS